MDNEAKQQEPNKKEPQTLTVAEVANTLRVSEDTVRDLSEKGEIPGAFRVGAQWRFSSTRLQEMIHGR